MRKQLKEMEDEDAALRQMHAKVEKEMGVQDHATIAVNQAGKDEVDARSVFSWLSRLSANPYIAQVLTVTSQKQKYALREAYKNKKLIPLDLCPNKTRAIRRHLTKHQLSLKTIREKKEMYSPITKYAIKV